MHDSAASSIYRGMNITPKDRSAPGDYERAEHRRREMTREELDTARAKYMQILNDIVARQYAKWPDEWKQAVPISKIAFETLTDHQVALCDVLPPQSIEEAVRLRIMWDIEYHLSMTHVIACRQGKHPTCIDGQPYDPRYQNPDTSPRKATT
ncbi:hypothetical protein UFOVP329_3 [uncultured Caudovirales phage]|uniref:Uncharacterized protein n=1 Tax=uncultured Caudovirales phage TaxID=2100421 RepID=A0A6J5LVZ7_9CAUD|nr:hypothetical protein UFOVP329_3 [uncultured Caudovirales phage]